MSMSSTIVLSKEKGMVKASSKYQPASPAPSLEAISMPLTGLPATTYKSQTGLTAS
jgi:hypothetical protein